MVTRAALVLSGGNAKRFQIDGQPWQDKALAQVDGKPLLLHVIDNIKNTVDKIVVCINDPQRISIYKDLLEEYGLYSVDFVVDQKSSHFRGPLLAITSGLAAVDSDYCLVIPTDMPFLNPKVANYLFEACVDYDVAVPMWPDGTVETLLMTLERTSCLEITQTLLAFNKPNADTIIRAAASLHLVSPLKEISAIDPSSEALLTSIPKKTSPPLKHAQTMVRFETTSALTWVKRKLTGSSSYEKHKDCLLMADAMKCRIYWLPYHSTSKQASNISGRR
jgi:molybdopterin-guanine dinucleotide biosynthesis protein A